MKISYLIKLSNRTVNSNNSLSFIISIILSIKNPKEVSLKYLLISNTLYNI